MLGQLIAQVAEFERDGSFLSSKVVIGAAHILLAVIGLAFGTRKKGQAERPPEPTILDEKQLVEQQKVVRSCVTLLLFIGAGVAARCIYLYLAQGSLIAYSNAWHAGTTMLLPAAVYWMLTRGAALDSPFSC